MKNSKEKTSKVIKDDKRRLPRQAGLTLMVRNYHTIDNERDRDKELQKIKDHIINQYIKEGFRMNGKTMELSEVAQYLNMPLKQVIRKITRFGDIMGGKDGEALARAVKLFAFSGSMATRSLVLGQAQNMLQAQGGQYVPFLTSEVNRSLANLIATDNTMLALLKAISPEPQRVPPSVVINNQQANLNTPGNTEQLLNINQAVKLIDQNREGTLLEDEAQQSKLLAEHIDSTIPEVIATQQKGFKQGDDGGKLKLKRKVNVHDNRREADGEIGEAEIIS